MQLGMIGLGRMGANMVRRLLRGGPRVRRLRRAPKAVEALVRRGRGRRRLARGPRRRSSQQPRAVWLMVPAAVVDRTHRRRCVPLLEPGDIVDRRRQLVLPRRHAAREGARAEGHPLRGRRHERRRVGARARLLPDDRRRAGRRCSGSTRSSPRSRPGVGDGPAHARARASVAAPAEQGYLHCGPNGAGHFVKMVHNGIEYGLMAAYAEGLNILRHANVGEARSTTVDAETTPLRDPEHYQYDLDLAEIAEVWRRGSVVALVAARPDRAGAAATTPSWRTSRAACRTRARGAGRSTPPSTRACPRRCSPTALYARFTSRGEADFADKLLSAMRYAFGGHVEKKPMSDAAPRPTRSSSSAPRATSRTRRSSRRSRRMVRRGRLDVPVIGVAQHGVDARAAPGARARQPRASTAASTTAALREAVRAAALRRRRLQRRRRPSPRCARRSAAPQRPLHYLAIPPEPVRDGRRGSSAEPAARRRARRGREAVRPRPRVGARAQRARCTASSPSRRLPHRPLPRQGAGAEPPLLPLRQLVPRADLEPQLRRERADHDGRGLRRAGARRVLRRGRRDPRRRPEPPAPGRRARSRWSRRLGP